MLRDKVTISWSEIDRYRDCPHAHDLTYKQRWVGKTTSPSLMKGSLLHKVLEGHYRSLMERPGDLISARLAAEQWLTEWAAEWGGENNEHAELVWWMYDGYVDLYGSDEDWDIRAVEQKLEVPLLTASGQRSRFTLKMQIDLIARDRTMGNKLFIWDHKCLADDSYVPTREGRASVADIQVGDHVVGSSGGYVRVAETYHTEQPCHTIRLRNGTEIVSSADHVWPVVRSYPGAGTGPSAELTTSDISDRLSLGMRYRMFPSAAVQSPEQDYGISPYLLGALLGDGGFTRGVSFTKRHVPTVDRVLSQLPEGTELRRVEQHVSKAPTYWFNGTIIKLVDSLGLGGHSGFDKFIPAEYLRGSFDQRLELLRGLMDTDGSHRKGVPLYQTGSQRLAHDVVRLVESLGGVAILWCNRAPKYQGGVGQPNWEVKMRFSREFPVPYHHADKIARYKPSHRTLTELLTIESVEPAGVRQCTDLEVESEDRLFAVQGVLTHNSGADLPKAKNLDMADQFSFYLWGMRQLGYPVFAAMWNGIRSKKLVREMTAQERFARPLLSRTDHELTTVAREAYATARKAYAAGAIAERHPDPDRCQWKCSFTEACLLGRKTSDQREREFLLDTGFIVDHTRH